MIYLVNCDKFKFFKTFDSFNSVVDYLKEINKSEFDGRAFSLFGRGQEEVPTEDGTEWIDSDYYIDSVVLCPKGSPNEYFTFFIRCIDSEGNLVELD